MDEKQTQAEVPATPPSVPVSALPIASVLSPALQPVVSNQVSEVPLPARAPNPLSQVPASPPPPVLPAITNASVVAPAGAYQPDLPVASANPTSTATPIPASDTTLAADPYSTTGPMPVLTPPTAAIMPIQTPAFATTYSSEPILTLSEVQAQKTKKRRRMQLFFTVVALVAAITTTAYMFLYYYPNKKSAQFVSKSKSIAADLAREVDNIKQNNFVQAKNITQSFQEAQSLLDTHGKDLKASKEKIASLKSDFDDLKPPSKNKKLAGDVSTLFDQATAITTKYDLSLTLRDQIFTAYATLPDELVMYNQIASSGGALTIFVTQTDRIATQAQNGLAKMAKLQPEPDDKPLYDIRMSYLQDTRDTFTRLNAIYRKYQPQQIVTELTQYNVRAIQRNTDTTRIINDYVDSSTLAKDFTAFKQSAEAVANTKK